jgi:hypothetical protein
MAMATMNTKSAGALLDSIMARAEAAYPALRSPSWTAQEDAFLRENLSWMTDAEIGEALGRTENAVHLRWTRDLLLPSPSKHPEIITANQAAKLIGIDRHKVAHWVDMGIIPGRLMAGGRSIRLINRVSLMVWLCSPKNWVYFDIKNVVDPKLKRMLKLRAQRWGDEWWTTRQVADYHGVETGDVKRYIVIGRLQSVRLQVSLGGRNQVRKWSNHFVLKSDALKISFCKGKGCNKKSQKTQQKFTPRADAWLLKARDELGMTFLSIGRTMKIGKEKVSNRNVRTNPTISYRYRTLCAIKSNKARKKRGHK